MPEDRTSTIESEVQNEQKPNLMHLVRLFAFGFSTNKTISCVYLGVFIILSILRPILALIWGRYIEVAETLSDTDHIIPAILLLATYFLINFLIGLINRYVMLGGNDIEQLNLVQANRLEESLHSKMYSKLAAISPETLEIPKINDRIDQVFNFICARRGGMNDSVIFQSYMIIAATISILSITATLFILNPWLCMFLLIAPIPTIWSKTIGHNMRFKFMKDNTKLLRMANYFEQLMLSPSAKEIKTLGLHDFFFDKWKNIIHEYTENEKKLIQAQSLFLIIFYSIMSITVVIGNIFAIILMSLGKLSLGTLGAALSLMSALVNDMKMLLSGITGVIMKKNEAAQFYDLMLFPEQKNEGMDFDTVNIIEARDVKYRYPLTECYVLNGVDLSIRKGEKVALVGENGSGKTTFVKLITGTLSPSYGELLINGFALEQLNTFGRYRKMSTVVQDPAWYFTFTVEENVTLGDVAMPYDGSAVDEALYFAGLVDVERDTVLGKDNGGLELSGGQWQKIAIARSAYSNRDFIVLDEPTSNLDPLSETDIFDKYTALAKDKTVLFVTHRISLASLADRIIVFADGVIVQDGTHDELIECQGEYARLYKEQAKWYDR